MNQQGRLQGLDPLLASRVVDVRECIECNLNLHMKIGKQRKKLLRAQEAAQECTTREQALKILRKAEKATLKLESAGESVRD